MQLSIHLRLVCLILMVSGQPQCLPFYSHLSCVQLTCPSLHLEEAWRVQFSRRQDKGPLLQQRALLRLDMIPYGGRKCCHCCGDDAGVPWWCGCRPCWQARQADGAQHPRATASVRISACSCGAGRELPRPYRQRDSAL